MSREWTVGVFEHVRTSGRVFLMAYVRDYNPAWEGCCVHQTQADTGAQAKENAKRQHQRDCMVQPSSVRPDAGQADVSPAPQVETQQEVKALAAPPEHEDEGTRTMSRGELIAELHRQTECALKSQAALQRELDHRAAAPPEGWQDIATCPKGKSVLLLRADGGTQVDDWAHYHVYNAPKFTHWAPVPKLSPLAASGSGETKTALNHSKIR